VTAGGREFQVAGAALLKDCLPMSVRLTASLKTTTYAVLPLMMMMMMMITLSLG